RWSSPGLRCARAGHLGPPSRGKGNERDRDRGSGRATVTMWLDTSVLVSLYVPEPRSARVARLVRRAGASIPFSQLHELELANALRLRLFRREAQRDQGHATRARVVEDLAT